MLMSAVSAEENITVDDGTDSASDYIELESNQGYIENISENPILNDDVMDDDENMDQSMMNQPNAQRQYGYGGGMRRHRRFRRRGYPFNSIRRVVPIIYPNPFFPFFHY